MRFGTTPRLLLVLAFLCFGLVCALYAPGGAGPARAAAAQNTPACAALPLPSAVVTASWPATADHRTWEVH